VPAATSRADSSRERSMPNKREELRSSRTELGSIRRTEPANMKRSESNYIERPESTRNHQAFESRLEDTEEEYNRVAVNKGEKKVS